MLLRRFEQYCLIVLLSATALGCPSRPNGSSVHSPATSAAVVNQLRDPAGPSAHSAAGHRPLPPDPEIASGFSGGAQITGQGAMIVAAHPLAARAGYRILTQGGSAIDALIAAQWVLNLVEPQSSGIGGGGLLMVFDGHKPLAYDGRETAPARATPELFLENGKPLGFREAVIGGRSVGVPGLVAMLELSHRRHGKLPWASLVEPALELCTQGFPVGKRLALLLGDESAQWLKHDADAAAYFFDAHGRPLQEGQLVYNPAFAEVLKAIAARGSSAFYHGDIAEAMVAKVQQHPTNPGLLDQADLASYRAKERPPLCFDYREYRLCGMPPPSSGTIAIGQVLGILHDHDLREFAPVQRSFGLEPAPQAVHLISEALRLAFADRARYLADSDYVGYPGDDYHSLLDPAYLQRRALLIGEQSMGTASPGLPPGAVVSLANDQSLEFPSTTHLSVVDRWGAAASMTASIESGFGSQLMVKGFLLNNELTDFSFVPNEEGKPVANRVEGGKRPRSSMSPMLVFLRASGRLVEVTGSPGGSAIISFVLKSLVGTLDWGLSPAQVVALPNFGSRNGPTELESERSSPELITWLEARGHQVMVRPQTSGVHLLFADPTRSGAPWLGAADPRREGMAVGGGASP